MDGFGKIAIAARLSKIEPAFFISWTRMILQSLRAGDIVLHPAVDIPHAIACNFLITQFLSSQTDSIMFVDDDHMWPDGTLDKLRETPDCDIVMPLICSRHDDFRPLVMRQNPTNTKDIISIINAIGVVKVDYVGVGFTLIKRKVVEDVASMLGTTEIFQFNPLLGEDGNFSTDARLVGARLSVNADIKVGHILPMVATWDSIKHAPTVETTGVNLKQKQKAVEERITK